MNCLNNIVGVSADSSSCINNGLTADEIASLRVSTSGLYLDTLPGGLNLDAFSKIDVSKNLAQMATKAINTAINQVQSDLIVALNQTYTTSQKAFMGTIGQASFAGSLIPANKYQGFLLRANDGADALLQINRIGLIVNGSQNLNILIYQAPKGSSMGTLIATFPIVTQANTYTYLIPPVGTNGAPAPMILPLTNDGQAQDYYFLYDSTGLVPRDNKIFCNCPGSPKNSIIGYVQPMGVQLDDASNFSLSTLDQTYMHGFLLDCQLKCNNEALICGSYSNQEAVAVVLAYATLFKAGQLAIEAAMASKEINRYTFQDKTYLWERRTFFLAEYTSRVNYLAENIDVTASNCFVCRDNTIYYQTPIVTDGGYQNIYDSVTTLNQADYMGFNPINKYTQQVPGVIGTPDKY